MPQRLTCPQGHTWEIASDDPVSAAQRGALCPVCNHPHLTLLPGQVSEGPVHFDLDTLPRAIHAAHQHDVIHRDLKPANILLARETEAFAELPPRGTSTPSARSNSSVMLGTPKITDFGLAKQLDTDSGQTQTGSIMGTP